MCLVEASVKPCGAQIGILPLLSDKAASLSMMNHTSDIVKKCFEFLSPTLEVRGGWK